MSDSVFRTEVERVKQLRDEQDLTFAQIGSITGLSETTARRRYKSGVLTDVAESIEKDQLNELSDFPEVPDLDILVEGPYIPENKEPLERFKPLRIVGDAVVTCDWHIPLHDPALVNNMISCAELLDFRKLIIAGDYWHMENFGSFLPMQPEASIEVERYDGNLIMKTLLETFEDIYLSLGNHDFRLVKKLGFRRSFEECMRWMLSSLSEDEWKRIHITDLDYMEYYPRGTGNLGQPEWRICHPKNFSTTPLTVGRKLAQKYNTNVFTAHSHHFAMGASPNGRDIVIEGGGFFNKNRTEYIQQTSNHHEWVPGYTIFIDGVPELVSPIFGNTKQYEGVKT